MKPTLRRPSWYAVVWVFACSAALSGAALAAAIHANATSDRKWCEVVSTLDNAWTESPPSTPSGRNLATDIHRLRGELGCPR